MPVARWGRTLADEPALMREFWAHEGDPFAVFDATLPTTEVFAPCCRRVVPADCVIDLRAIPDTVIRPMNVGEPEDLDFACDGCVDLLYRDPANDWTRSKLMEARGAPIALVHEVRADEVQIEIARERYAQSAPLPHYPQQARDGALLVLAMEHRAAVEATARASVAG